MAAPDHTHGNSGEFFATEREMLLDLDCPASWPAELLQYLGKHYELFLGWETGQAQAFAQSFDELTLLKQVVEQGPERGRNFDEAMHGLRVALQPYAIPGWHCSRLTEAEVYGIRSKGMKPPNAEMLARRIDALMEAGEITPEMGRRLKLENQAGDKNRAGRTWFCFFPPSNAGEDGIARFFRHWGGEALYFCHENDPVLSSAISCIGTPCLVEADVPIASLRMHGALEQAIYRRYLVSQDNSKVWPTDYEDCIEYPLPAGNVRRVITFPDPEFMSLTGCSEWRRPIPEG